jgi:hypothetical protein
MSGGVYFEGDPATDSARRHMERVLKGEPTRRWPWLLAALGSGAVWALYRLGKTAAANREVTAAGDGTEAARGKSSAKDR